MAALNVPPLEVFRVWGKSKTVEEFCAHFDISRSYATTLAARYKLPKKKPTRKRRKNIVDPTPEEITTRAAEVRKKWTAQEHLSRSGAAKGCSWHVTVPVYNYSSSTGLFRPSTE